MTDDIVAERGEWDVDYEYRHPVWNRHGMIDIEINHPRLGWVPCTVNEAEYSLIWARLMKDDVAPYVPDLGQLALIARLDRNRLLATYVDPFVMNPFRWADLDQDQQRVILEYRAALLALPDQPEFPVIIDWPRVPDGIPL